MSKRDCLMCDEPAKAEANRKRIAGAGVKELGLPDTAKASKAVCVYTDGSTTDICFVVTDNGRVRETVRRPASVDGAVTSNEGEYWAVIHALSWLSANDVWTATIMSDSLLVVSQICGLFKVNEPRLAHLLSIVCAQLTGMHVDFQWTPRENNLAGLVLEEKGEGGGVRAKGKVCSRSRV